MPSVEHAYLGPVTMFDALDPIELVTLYGCLTRAHEQFMAQTIRWDGSKDRRAAYAKLKEETAVLSWTALDVIATMLSSTTEAKYYAYDTHEMMALPVT